MKISILKGLSGLLFFIVPFISTSQLNMTLQDSVTYTAGVNDICGWAAPDGQEYAIVGLHGGVAIVDINKDTFAEIAFIPTVNNQWKDINTYSHYAYVCSEANVGLLIIDLQYLPDSVQTYIWQDSLPSGDTMRIFRRAHTLWTDEKDGLLFLNGSNLNRGGVIMLDVASDPTDPKFLGYAPDIYSHDCYTRDSIIYSAEILAGNLSIYDAHDPQNIFLVGSVKTPQEFTHNAWLSDDSRYMFTTDERANSYVTSYDISDPENIIELDRYRQASTEGAGHVVHNVYVWKDDWLVVAYYSNGTVIVDASRPDNLVEVGNFDSYPGSNVDFPGVWGSYPWLPSERILSSDRNSGLYVFEPTYVRACFLEGMVVDSLTGAPLTNALVSIESEEVVMPQASGFNGIFKMGKAVPGSYNVTVSKEAFYSKTITLEFINGVVLEPVIALVPIPNFQLGGKVIYADGGNVSFAKVSLVSPSFTYEVTTDEFGDFTIPALYGGTYDLQAGIWGHTYESVLVMDGSRQLTIQLVPGYVDDFDLDLGWTTTGDAISGVWERGKPNQQLLLDTYLCSSEGDSPNDNGGFAFTTGISTSDDVLDNEVSGGTTWLLSPMMDLTKAINNPKIQFDYWLCEYPANQYTGLSIWLNNGADTILLEELKNDTIAGSWQSKSYPALGHFNGPDDQLRLMISATDTTSGQDEYILKVHFDNFKIYEGPLSSIDPNPSGKYFVVYPNPVANGELNIKHLSLADQQIITLHFYDIQGRLLFSQQDLDNTDVLTVQLPLENGMYFMQWETAAGASGVEKVMVMNK